MRLDQVLVSRCLVTTRTKAQALILAGRVFSGETRLDKPGIKIDADLPLEIKSGPRYVSRGGHKLHGALSVFGIEPAGRDTIDVGASTGGFTQVLLEAGAARVISLDVGRGQLDWNLRNDERVFPIEGVNARYLDASALPFTPDLAVIDVSFISLKLILPAVVNVLGPYGEIVALVKPQFEVGRGKVGRGGIVRDRRLHREVLESLATFSRGKGWFVSGLGASPIKGAEGNTEFFIHLKPSDPRPISRDLSEMVEMALASSERS